MKGVEGDPTIASLFVGEGANGQYSTGYGPLMAGYALASLPLLLLVAVVSR